MTIYTFYNLTLSEYTIELFLLFTSKITNAWRYISITPYLLKYATASRNLVPILFIHFLQSHLWNELLHR